MSYKSRSNYALTGSMSQDKFDKIFQRKNRAKKQDKTKKLQKQRKRGT